MSPSSASRNPWNSESFSRAFLVCHLTQSSIETSSQLCNRIPLSIMTLSYHVLNRDTKHQKATHIAREIRILLATLEIDLTGRLRCLYEIHDEYFHTLYLAPVEQSFRANPAYSHRLKRGSQRSCLEQMFDIHNH